MRILCLHGFGQNADCLSRNIGALRKMFRKSTSQAKAQDSKSSKIVVDFVFLDAPFVVTDEEMARIHGGGDHSDITEKIVEDATSTSLHDSEIKITRRAWWRFASVVDAQGLDETLLLIKKTLQEQGPFDGILGFSQGAMLTTILCALNECQSVRFCILISGRLLPSFVIKFEEQFTKFKDDKIKTLHVVGQKDELVPTQESLQLASTMFPHGQVYTHAGGHLVPLDTVSKRTISDFIKTQNI